MADIEVTVHTVPAASRFWHQVRNKPGPDRPDERLSYRWTVVVSEPVATGPQPPLRHLIEALIPVLAQIEAIGETPAQMHRIADQALTERGLNRWSDTKHRIRVWTPPEPIAAGKGGVRILGNSTHGVSWGNEALKSAIRESVEKKTKRDQMRNAPDQKWLAVILTGSHPLSQFNDSFGPHAQPPYPFEALDGLRFDYFDEVWVIGPSMPDKYTVVRIARPPRHPSRHAIRSTALPL